MFFSNLDPSHMRNSGFSVVSFYLLVSEEWHFHWGGYAVLISLKIHGSHESEELDYSAFAG